MVLLSRQLNGPEFVESRAAQLICATESSLNGVARLPPRKKASSVTVAAAIFYDRDCGLDSIYLAVVHGPRTARTQHRLVFCIR